MTSPTARRNPLPPDRPGTPATGRTRAADGRTYAEIDDRGAAQAVVDARESAASEAEVADLQATADELKAQRDSLFRGETLRGLLLSSYAWSTIGQIAAIAAWVAFAGAAVMAARVAAGLVHLLAATRRRRRPARPERARPCRASPGTVRY